jgi:hypothetical protein
MSKGYGAIQRRLLDTLAVNDADPFDDEYDYDGRLVLVDRPSSWTLLTDLAGCDATPSQFESTRRALAKLADAGVVQLYWVLDRRAGRSSDRWYLAARLTPDKLTQQKLDAEVDRIRGERSAVAAERRARGLYGPDPLEL